MDNNSRMLKKFDKGFSINFKCSLLMIINVQREKPGLGCSPRGKRQMMRTKHVGTLS
jgi:hypothetical protein